MSIKDSLVQYQSNDSLPRLTYCLMSKVSVLSITYNDQHRIAEFVKSALCWADECILCDKGSSDETIVIARDLGATVIPIPFSQRGEEDSSWLATLPSYDWILCMTPGDTVQPQLQEQIRDIVSSSSWRYPLVHLPVKVISFGIFSIYSPWSIQSSPRLYNRLGVTVRNRVHDNFYHVPQSQRYHVAPARHNFIHHVTHSSAATFIPQHNEYAFSESRVLPPRSLYYAALKELFRPHLVLRLSIKLRKHLHAWMLYQHMRALYALEAMEKKSASAQHR